MSSSKWETKRILITVKAYPQPSRRYGEAVCVAGITDEGKWIRLYPVQFRDLPREKQFRKYEWIEAKVIKSADDPRPESYHVDLDSIRKLSFVDTKNNWAERKKIVLPLLNKSLEELIERWKNENISLGLIKPREVLELVIHQETENWKPEKEMYLRQISFFSSGQKQVLEKVPWSFAYKFSCDDEKCSGEHILSYVDWEIYESYRSWRKKYKDETLTQIKKKYFDYFKENCDLYFYVGTVYKYHRFGRFVIIGAFYPPKN